MPAIPHDWSVIVAGAWNRAILTPQGISKRLFLLPAETAVEIQVAMNEPGLIRVLHDGVIVTPGLGQLIVAPNGEPTEAALMTASRVASNALVSLPETPVTASGVNIRYKYDALPDQMIALAASDIDDKLSDQELQISTRAVRRMVQWGGGVINIELQENQDASGLLSFNFHRESTEANTHVQWIAEAQRMLNDAARLRVALEGA